MGLRYIEDLQAAAAGIVHGVGRAAGGLGQITNADTAVVHKMAVPFLHAAPKVILRRVGYLVRTALDPFVDVNVCLRPVPCLATARQHQNQPDLWVAFP